MIDYLATVAGVTGMLALIFGALALLADYLEGEEQSLRERYENWGKP